jgi:mannan endo-1,4-beta-mannosidase
MKMKHPYIPVCFGILLIILSACSEKQQEDPFVRVVNTGFVLNEEPYYFAGANFWYGPYLGMVGENGDRDRLLKELDLMASTGIKNLRILAASEMAGHSRVLTPSFQTAPGMVNEDLLVGLDFLIAEMGKRDLKAVIFMNNFWEWSGGMSVYGEWFGEGVAIDPAETGDWHGFMNQSAKFYKNKPAQKAWHEYLTKVITRTNTISGIPYNEDPVIMSWQLANEPRPGNGDEGRENARAFIEWVHESARFIKALAPNQLVSTGNEGLMGCLGSEEIYVEAHKSPYVDYLTFHMWPKNWGWFKAEDMAGSFPHVKRNARMYIQQHVEFARKLNKPIVLSEFGLGRDYESFEPGSSVEYRDAFLEFIFNIVQSQINSGSALAGTNVWSWGGFGIPQHADARWRPGDPLVGDPPQEPQGLNSVFASDTTTLKVIREHIEYVNSYQVLQLTQTNNQ